MMDDIPGVLTNKIHNVHTKSVHNCIKIMSKGLVESRLQNQTEIQRPANKSYSFNLLFQPLENIDVDHR